MTNSIRRKLLKGTSAAAMASAAGPLFWVRDASAQWNNTPEKGAKLRVLPEECGSYEDNPPTLLEYTRRDLRWCQGNMQYVKLLNLENILPMSRFQLLWAISMFIGVPAWTAII